MNFPARDTAIEKEIAEIANAGDHWCRAVSYQTRYLNDWPLRLAGSQSRTSVGTDVHSPPSKPDWDLSWEIVTAAVESSTIAIRPARTHRLRGADGLESVGTCDLGRLDQPVEEHEHPDHRTERLVEPGHAGPPDDTVVYRCTSVGVPGGEALPRVGAMRLLYHPELATASTAGTV